MKMIFEVPALDRIADQLEKINGTLIRLVHAAEKIEVALNPPEAERIIFFLVEDDKTTRITGGVMNQKVTEVKKFGIKITDRFGNDAPVDGLPAWSLTNESLATLEVAEDGMSVVVTPAGMVGAAELQVLGDADMGEGVKQILGKMELNFIAGEAEVIAIGEIPMPVEEPPVEEEPVEEEPVVEEPTEEPAE